MSRSIDLSAAGYGLTHERHLHINRMLMDFDPKLSLRRIGERDPAFRENMRHDPPKTFGVWEEGVAEGQSNWVFFLAEMSIDERVLARVMENSFARNGGAKGMFDKWTAFLAAQEASKLKAQMDQMAEREEEMLGLGKLAAKKHTFRHRIGGEDVIVGDRVRPLRRNL